MTPALPRMTRNEQMMAQVVLGVAIDLFTTAEQETFTRAEALIVLDSVRTDPLFFDARMVIAHEELDKTARAAIFADDAAPAVAGFSFTPRFRAQLREELEELQDQYEQAAAMTMACEPDEVRARGARLCAELDERIGAIQNLLDLGGEGL